MANLDFIGHIISATLFLLLSGLLFKKLPNNRQARLLLLACIITSAWAWSNAYYLLHPFPLGIQFVIELIKDGGWLLFLVSLLREKSKGIPRHFSAAILLLWFVFLVYGISITESWEVIGRPTFTTHALSTLVIVLIGLVLVEQLFRNTPSHKRWSIKFLCLGVGGMFAYDIFLYSSALLYHKIDLEIWGVRSIVYVFTAPLIAISAIRDPDWSVVPYVSRKFVFYSTSLVAAGGYLLLMAGGGYYIKIYGGEWGGKAQIIFFFGAILLLLVIMFSGQAQARLKQLVNEQFYHYKYDYREEWLRLMRILSSIDDDLTIYQRVLKAVAQIVESPAGLLWIKNDSKQFVSVATWNVNSVASKLASDKNNFLDFIEAHQWVLDVIEYKKEPNKYENLNLPDWVLNIPRVWLIVPILHEERLFGFIILTKSRAAIHHTWEDNELLRTVGQQVASYLVQYEASKKLADAQKFEAFSRLSAYVVHDLKNLVAQLGLVVSNSKRFGNDPEFVVDAFNTVDNAVAKMNRLLAQLRKDRFITHTTKLVSINKLLSEILEKSETEKPIIKFRGSDENLFVNIDEDRFSSVIEHLIQNARDATSTDGEIVVNLSRKDKYAVIEVIDTGCGMDEKFIRERLFRPFDTTKGNAGMGIGVYESREFIQTAGGDFQVVSTSGKGSKFTISLPLMQPNSIVQLMPEAE
jgi:putative PEP-CTERM system histidine kinase